MLIDRGYYKAAIRLIWDILNTTIYIIFKYLYYIKLIKGKALAVPKLIFKKLVSIYYLEYLNLLAILLLSQKLTLYKGEAILNQMKGY